MPRNRASFGAVSGERRGQVATRCAVAIALALLGLASPAIADDACEADAQRICAGATNDARSSCLMEHAGQVSGACAQSLSASASPAPRGGPRSKQPRIGDACRHEFATLCPQLPSSSRREEIVQCLKEHASDLSSDCTAAIDDHWPQQGPVARRRGGMGRRGGGTRGGGFGEGRGSADDAQ
jgi:hypothetical protein